MTSEVDLRRGMKWPGKISLAMAFWIKIKRSSMNHKACEGFCICQGRGLLNFAPSPPWRPIVKSLLSSVFLNGRGKGKRVFVMLQGDYGATLERLWSYPARRKGRSEQMVWEADGASEILLCERGISQGEGEGEGNGKKEREKRIDGEQEMGLYLMSVFKVSGW